MIIVLSTLGLTSSDLDTRAMTTRGGAASRSLQLSAMRFEPGQNSTVMSMPGLTESHTTSGYSYPTQDSSVLDVRKAGELTFASSVPSGRV